MHPAVEFYLKKGISILPVNADKTPKADQLPVVAGSEGWPSWKLFQTRIPLNREAENWAPPIAIVARKGLICIDFDDNGSKFIQWRDMVAQSWPELVLKPCTLQKTPSGGWHFIFRTDIEARNAPLAKTSDNKVLIEIRGDGGYFLAAPSEGYKRIEGQYDFPEAYTEEETNFLFDCARSFNEKISTDPTQAVNEIHGNNTPFNDYNAKNTPISLLEKHGWTVVFTKDEAVYLKRPDKKGRSVSATWNHIEGRFWCFSSSTPFQPEKSYLPSSVYTVLVHDGNYFEAAKALGAEGYGEPARNPNTPPKEIKHTDAPQSKPSSTHQNQSEGVRGVAGLNIKERMTRLYVERQQNGSGILLGHKLIDDITGGLRPGDVFSIVANPGCFKTNTLINFLDTAMQTAEGFALFVSLEMQIEAEIERELVVYEGIRADDFVDDKLKWAELTKKLENSHRNRILVSDRVEASIPQIMADITASEKKTGKKCALVGIDYLDFMDSEGRNEYDQVKSLMLGIKRKLAKIKRVPVILLAQTNRENKSNEEEVGARSGKGGTAIEATSDFMLGLWMDGIRIVGRVTKHRRLSNFNRQNPYFEIHLKDNSLGISKILEIDRPNPKKKEKKFGLD